MPRRSGRGKAVARDLPGAILIPLEDEVEFIWVILACAEVSSVLNIDFQRLEEQADQIGKRLSIFGTMPSAEIRRGKNGKVAVQVVGCV
jgi:hypothetical protein